MIKHGMDPKVKKTLVRNSEYKTTKQKPVTREAEASCSKVVNDGSAKRGDNSRKDSALNRPTLCSSDALANYLTDISKSLPPPVTIGDLNVDKEQLCVNMTKKLNFHYNDRMYKNLVELNANADTERKLTRKEKKPTRNSTKRDLEPKIEDFCQDEKENDLCPTIPIPKPKFKPIRKVEDGQLHKLVASFENL